MSNSGAILVTGATGFLGRYLVRDLLASGRRVAVLVRDAGSVAAAEHVRQLAASWADVRHPRLVPPVVLTGDLRIPGLGLRAADRAWLARHCRAVLHAAADVALRRAPGRDPWTTNVGGTEHVLALCADLAIREVHHISTAFVCGDRPGPVREDELDCGQGFHNDYERSKFEAERRVRAEGGVRATVYRPAVIVGDSRTGYTSSYHGFYRFLELADRLATPPLPPAATAGEGRRVLPLCLPFTGDEPRNLVPVDWVAQAVVRLVNRPRCHGRTYHLVARTPVRVRDVKEAAAHVLGIEGASWAGGEPADPAPLEELFRAQVRDYEPYLGGDPVFDCRNTRAALPWFPPPRVDHKLLTRLIRFAAADGWGRSRRQRPGGTGPDCGDYVEHFFPEAVRRSLLARLPLDVALGLDVRGPGGGRWSVRCRDGQVIGFRRGTTAGAEVVYRLDVPTFAAVVRGRLAPQEAFLARRIEIEGDVEKALKLAVLFGYFVQECPYAPAPTREAEDAAPLSA
jgi:nucleoside-diphosphate-sugar epimerase